MMNLFKRLLSNTVDPDQLRLEMLRQAHMKTLGSWVIGIAIFIVLESIPSDRSMHPDQWNWTWGMLSVGIIPIGAIGLWLIWGKHLGGLLADVALYIVVVYIAMIHAYFLKLTGYEDSAFVHAFVSILYGISFIPLRSSSYLILLLSVLTTYMATVVSGGMSIQDFVLHDQGKLFHTHVILSIFLFYATRFSRTKGYRSEIALQNEISSRESEIARLVGEQLKTRQDEALVLLASQVAHDIRSPLAALEMVSRDLNEVPEEKRLVVRQVSNRITDIANQLLTKYKRTGEHENKEELKPILLASALHEIVTEKRIQYRLRSDVEIDLHIHPSGYGVFAKVDAAEFARVISNVINNSVEAIETTGLVAISLRKAENSIVLQIKDNGKGMPDELLQSLGRPGQSHGKTNGFGLGLFHARNQIKNWNGDLQISSRVFEGTTVDINLPTAQVPT